MDDTADPYFFHPLWPVLYMDNHLLALYKPAGLLVQGDKSGHPSLLDLGKRWIKRQCNKPGNVFLGMVHRLDRPVAGVILFARTSKAAGRLSAQFRLSEVRKKYIAVTEGTPAMPSGTLDQHIERRRQFTRIAAGPGPGTQAARLHFRLVGTHGANSLLEIEPETGRHHQIRAQMAHLGCPILGDVRYGASGSLPERQIALMSGELSIEHPTRGERIILRSPVPREWPWPAAHADRRSPLWTYEAFLRNRLFIP